MNFCRKSTDGFSIGNVLLDFLGGVTNYGQMAVQSIDQGELNFFTPSNAFSHKIFSSKSKLFIICVFVCVGSWVNFYGNIGKTLISLVCPLPPLSDFLRLTCTQFGNSKPDKRLGCQYLLWTLNPWEE